MKTPYLPFYKRILFKLLLPVVAVGLLVSTLLVYLFSAPLEAYLHNQFDTQLQLAATLAEEQCEKSFDYMLELRLERNQEVNSVLKQKALEEMAQLSSQFSKIQLMVVESGALVRGVATEKSTAWTGPELKGKNDVRLQFNQGEGPVIGHVQFFPFWDWHIISFTTEKEYLAPVRMAYFITYSSAAGVFAAVIVLLLFSFYILVNNPLQKLIAATNTVAEGKLETVELTTTTEFSQLKGAFNQMVESLNNEQQAVNTLITKLHESEAMFRSQFEYGSVGISVFSMKDSSIQVNKRLAHMLGYTRNEFQALDWKEVTHPDDVAHEAQLFDQVLTGAKENYQLNKRVIHKNGEILHVQVTVTCDRDKDGTLRFVIVSVQDITGRIKAERAQEEANRRLRFVMDSMPIRVFWKDREGRFLGGNKHFIQGLGLRNEEELIGKTDFDMAYTAQAEKYRADDRRIMESGEAELLFEEPQDKPDGSTAWHLVNKLPMYNADEEVVGLLGTFQDITEWKESKEQARKSLVQLQSIYDSLPVIAWSLDAEGIFTMSEGKGLSLIGLKPGEVVGRSAFEMYKDYPEIYESVTQGLQGKLQAGEHYVGDTVFQYVVTPIIDEQGTVQGINGLAMNITDQKQAEDELRKLRNYLSNIIDSMPSVLVGVDKDGCITQWNSEAIKLTGVTAENAQGKSFDALFPNLQGEMQRVKEAIAKRQVMEDHRQSRKYDGETRYEDVTIYPLVANGVEGAVIRVDDVTDRVRIEEMMVQSEKMLSVGGLAAGMAHEINNPLAGIIQTVNVMKTRLLNFELVANVKVAEEVGVPMERITSYMEKRGIMRMVDSVNDSGKRVSEIVNNMLSFARKSDAIISSYSPETLLDQILELAATDYDLKKQYDFKMIKIVKEYGDNLPLVVCEGAKIQQVLLNILRNGAQAMQEEGTFDNEQPRFILRLEEEIAVKMLRIEIEDNGPGMDQATRQRVFEPFFTTKPTGSGTGLGLSVSYFIITENHNGTMDVISEPGNGANFIIRLPLDGSVARESGEEQGSR